VKAKKTVYEDVVRRKGVMFGVVPLREIRMRRGKEYIEKRAFSDLDKRLWG